MMQKLKIAEPVGGFTERDSYSKAILNTDIESLLQYKIQQRKVKDINSSKNEIANVRMEMQELKNDLSEIKKMLLDITNIKSR